MSGFTDSFGPGGGSQRLASFTPQGQIANGGTAVGTPGHGLLDLIPSLTGVLGGIGGAAAGTAIAPGVGTAVGGIGGAGAGQAAGKAIENALTGDKTTLGGEAEQAAVGAGSQAAGGLLGKAAGFVGSKIAGGVGSAGTDLLSKSVFGGATKGAQIANKAGDTIKTLTGLGIAPQAIEQAIPQVTGDSGALTQAVRTALTKAGPVDLTESFPMAGRAADQLDVNKPGAGNAFRTVFNNMANNTIAEGQPITKVNAQTAFDMMKQLEANGFAKGTDPATRSAYLDVANHIGDQLTKSGADKAVLDGSALDPKAMANLSTISPKLAAQASAAKTVGDLRTLQAPFVRAGKLIQDAADQGQQVSGAGAGPGVIDAAGAIASHGATIPLTLGKMALKSSGGQAAVGTGLQTTGGILGKFMNPVDGATAGAAVANTVPAISNVVNESKASTTPITTTTTASNDSAGTTDPNAADSSIFSPEHLQALAISDLAKTGGKNLAQIAQLNTLFGPKSDTAQLTTAQKNEATGSQKALSTLGDFATQLSGVGGGKGPVGGAVENFLGGTGIPGTAAAGNAHALESQRIDVATTIAGSLSPTGRPAASVIKLVLDGLPSISDPQSVASAKISQLTQRIKDGYYTALQPATSGASGVSTATAP